MYVIATDSNKLEEKSELSVEVGVSFRGRFRDFGTQVFNWQRIKAPSIFWMCVVFRNLLRSRLE